MRIIEAVNLAYREARERGELDYWAFERAVAVYRERRPDAEGAHARFQVARMIAPVMPPVANGARPAVIAR